MNADDRSRHHPARFLTVVVVLSVLASLGVAAGATAAPRAGEARSTKSSAAGWPTAGQNLDNTRAAVASTIKRENVKTLGVAFSTELPGAVQLTTAPVVVDGTVYLQGGTGAVVAVDATSGTIRWKSAPTGYNIGPFGVAIADGRVFADAGSDGILALDQNTGTELWRTKLSTTPTMGVDIQPIVFDGLVFAATVPVSTHGIYTPGDRGLLYALDATTGAVKWSFDTVKGDLWGHPEVNSGGGAWYPPAIDTKRRIVYFGTANPAPFVGTAEFPNGTSRPGDNLYTDSVVALDVDTGKLVWYHQVTKHDLFDRDQVHVMLAHLRNGRKVVISAGKSGEVVGLSPDTGKVLWKRAVGKHENDTDAVLHGPTVVYPGTYGGILTPPATARGIVYVATNNAPTTLLPDKPSYFGGQLGTHPGQVVAINASTGRVVWDTEVPGDPLGGATVVNNLVFTALLDGTVIALDRTTGELLWKDKLSGGINGWMTPVADTLYVPVGNAKPPRLVALRRAPS